MPKLILGSIQLLFSAYHRLFSREQTFLEAVLLSQSAAEIHNEQKYITTHHTRLHVQVFWHRDRFVIL
jgi:hypothetical protein